MIPDGLYEFLEIVDIEGLGYTLTDYISETKLNELLADSPEILEKALEAHRALSALSKLLPELE